MSEKIVDIKGVKGNNNKIVASGITSIDIEKFTKTFNDRHSELRSLVTSVCGNSTLKVLNNIRTNQQSTGLAVIGYLSGIQSLVVGYAETISNSLFKLVKISEQQKFSSNVTSIPEQKNVVINPNRLQAQTIIDKFIVESKQDIKDIKFKDVIQPVSKNGTQHPIVNLNPLNKTVGDLYIMFDLFTTDWHTYTHKPLIIDWSGLLKELSNQNKLFSSVDKSADVNPTNTNKLPNNPKQTDNFAKQLFEYLLEIKTILQEKNKQSTLNPGSSTSNVNVNYSGNFNVSEIINMLDKTAIYDPIRIGIFKKSFITIASTVSEGIAILMKSISGNAEIINSTTSLVSAIGNIVSLRTDGDQDLSILGVKIKSRSRKNNPFEKKNIDAFSNGFVSAANAIQTGIDGISNIKINSNKISSVIQFLNGITSLIDGTEEKSKSIFFGSQTKITYSFSNKKVSTFKRGFQKVVNGIQSSFDTVNKIKVPNKNKILDISDYVSAFVEILDSTKASFVAKTIGFRIGITNIVSGIVGSMALLQKSKANINKSTIDNIKLSVSTFVEILDSTKVSFVAKSIGFRIGITNIVSGIVGSMGLLQKSKANINKSTIDNIKLSVSTFVEILDSTKASFVAKSIGFKIGITNIVSGIVGSIACLHKSKQLSKSQLESFTSITNLLESLAEAFSVKNFKPRGIKILVKGMQGFQKVLTTMAASEKIMKRGVNAFCNAVETIGDRLSSNKNEKVARNVKMLAGGMATLGLALFAFALLSPVILIASLGLLAFGFALSHMSSTKSIKDIAIFTFSLATLGVAIWAFGEIVSVKAIGGVVLALASLAGAIWLFSGGGSKYLGVKNVGPAPYKNMLWVALGLAALGGSLWVWQKLGITGETVFKVIGGVVALAGAAWAYSKVKDVSLLKMIGTALSIGVLGLSIYAWQLMGITTDTCVNVAIGAGALLMAAIGFSKVSGKSLLMMAGTGLAIGIMGLGVAAWHHLGVTWQEAVGVAGAVAALGLSSMIYLALNPMAALNLALIGVAVGILGFGVSQFRGVTNEQLIQTGLFVGAIGLASYLFANPLALIGAASMLAVGASVALLAVGMKTMVDAGIDNKRTTEFMDSISTICLGFMKIAIPAIPAAAAALLMIPVAGSSILIAGSLAVISMLTYNPMKMQQFGESVVSLANTFDSLGLISTTKAVVKAGLMVPIATVTILTGSAIALITAITYNPQKMRSFGDSVTSLMNTYDSLGIIQLGKTSIKAIALLPIVGSTILTATAIRIVQAINIDSKKLQSNALGMQMFIETMTDVFGTVGEKVKTVKRGIEAVGGLASVVKSLADCVFTMAQLEYTENEVRNGKIVPKAVRKLTEADFVKVGTGIGKMLNSLIDPLITIGSSQDTYTIGGIKIQNPFGSGNKVKKGIDALSNIGSIFTPLANVVKSFADAGIFGPESEKSVEKLNAAIGSLVSGVSGMLIKLSTIEVEDPKGIRKLVEGIQTVFDPIQSLIKSIFETGILSDDNKGGSEKLNTAINGIVDSVVSMTTKLSTLQNPADITLLTTNLSTLLTTISKADPTGLKGIRSELDLIYTKLSNKKLWDGFQSNIKHYETSIAQIKKEINGIDLEKAVILNSLANNIKDANDNGNIESLIEQIRLLIDKVNTTNEVVAQNTTTTTESNNTILQTIAPKAKDGKPIPQQKQKEEDNQSGAVAAKLQQLISIFNRPLTIKQSSGDVFTVEMSR